jgi:hypothetical protein
MIKTPKAVDIFDRGENIDDFMREIAVVCPKCESQAQIFVVNNADAGFFTARRLVCPRCAFTREWNAKTFRRITRTSPLTEGFFGARLWLQTACGNETLWAYNITHLTFIENYVCAKQRKRARREDGSWHNRSLSSRLPKWIGAAGNRETILKAIEKLKVRYAESGA